MSRVETPVLVKTPQYRHSRNESKEILLTDLELWTALVSDYTQTATRLPTLTSRKIRAGIPQPLRGLVWQAMSGARDTHLEGLYHTLCVEKNTPFEKVIGRDLMRTFPEVEMFKQEGGTGQSDLGKVLRAFSLYDTEVGYCQGLGFLVAPLLMNMSHQEAFCVLVRIMEGYGMRSMYTETLSGLKLRLFQFEKLLVTNVPDLAAHFEKHDIAPAVYASQWFLSVFAVTCPLATLHRVYDLLLAEGAPETMLRLALTLLIKNKNALMTLDMEDSLSLLLSKSLWESYDEDDDMLITDTVSLSDTVTTEALLELEAQYEAQSEPVSNVSGRGIQAVATDFLGRMSLSKLFSSDLSRTTTQTSSEKTRSSTSSFSIDPTLQELTLLKSDNANLLNSLDEIKAVAGDLLAALAASQPTQHLKTQLSQQISKDPLTPGAYLSLEKIHFLESELDDRNHEVGRMRNAQVQLKNAVTDLTREKARLEKSLNEIRLRPRGTLEDEVESLRIELGHAKAAVAISTQESEESKYALRKAQTPPSTGVSPSWFWKR